MTDERFIPASDGTGLYVRERRGPGAGYCVLADGIACDGFIWKYLFDAIAQKTSVVHFHYRGHGRSRAPADPTHLRVEHHAEDLVSVRDAVGDPDVVLLGHSMGCQVVLESFRIRPEKVKGMVLFCGAPGRVTHTFKGSDALARVLPGLIKTVDEHPKLSRAVWGNVPPMMSLKIALSMGEVDKNLMEPEDLLPYLEHMVDIDLPMFLRMLKAAGEHDASDILPKIDVPVLVVAGEKDTFTPPRLAEEMAKALPKGELWMTGGTHVVPLELRAAVEEKIFDFIEKVGLTSKEAGAVADASSGA